MPEALKHCSDFLLVIFARALYAAPAMHWLRKNIYVCWKGFPVREGGCLHVQPTRLTPRQGSQVHTAQDIIMYVPAHSHKAEP